MSRIHPTGRTGIEPSVAAGASWAGDRESPRCQRCQPSTTPTDRSKSGTHGHTLGDGHRMDSTPKSALIPTFAALRFATGVAAWLAPNKTARLLGLGSAHQQPFTDRKRGG